MRMLLLVPLAALAACSTTGGGAPADPASGSISGRIIYPSEVAPAMRICALGAESRGCTDSPAGRALYRIDHLSAGDYQLVARLVEGDMRVGGHVQPVQCIQAPCPDQLKTVTVAAGAAVAGIDLNGFYPAREEFPLVP